MSGRLLFRVDPVAGESPRGYLCRAAHEHGYSSPNALAQIAGLWVSGAGNVGGLDHDAAIPPLSCVLRLEPEEWRSICYHHIKGRTRFKRSFHSQTISADDLNYRRPRLCAACLRERSIWWAVWDLGLVAACPVHRCLLLNQCPSCKRGIAWERPAVHKCRCGFDLREISPGPADSDLVAINAIVYRAAQSTQTQTVEIDLGEFDFPPELLHLKLGALLRFILFVGSISEGSVLRRKQRPFCATDLTLAMTICRGAAALLRDWPQPLREVLRRMIPQSANVATLNFSDIFGNFYRHVFRVLPRREFGFLHDAFEQFVIEDWKGFIRGQHRYFSAAVRRNSHWVTANEAERIARDRRTNLGSCQGGPSRRHIPEGARWREPHGVLDSAGITQPMDRRTGRGIGSVYAAFRGCGDARPEKHQRQRSRRRRGYPLCERSGPKFPDRLLLFSS